MFQPLHPLRPASGRELPPDMLSGLLTLDLPRGRQDIYVRVTSYPDGSRALELRDADQRPFYWPTMAVCRVSMAELLPPELVDAVVVAVKPSSLNNGMAYALVEGGVLIDLGIEMPSDRHFVRLMQVNEQTFAAAAQAEAQLAQAVRTPMALASPPVPARWQQPVARIRAACARRGIELTDGDAMLAWALAGGAISREPPRLPGSGEEIFALLRPLLTEAKP